jgi:hypothetical protein
MQSPQILLVDNDGNQTGLIGLTAASETPAFLTSDPSRVDLILKGLASQTAQENDPYVVDALRNIRFGPPGAGGTDLAALDIQRGRDHGLLNSYSRMRTSYGLAPFDSFSQLTSDVELQAALAAVYGTVDNVDGWIAMIAEDHVAGSSLGVLARTILERQFTRLRDGDRFFFTGDPDLQSPLVTSVIDLDSITLSQIIKRNTSISRLQRNVFFVVPEPASWLLAVAGAMVGIQWRRRRSVDVSLRETHSPLAEREVHVQMAH